MAAQSPRSVYASNGWEIDLTRRELRLRDVSVPIGSRAFEILEILVQARGELVNKYKLMDQIWPGAIVEENTLQFHISAIRKALGDDRGLLKTVSGRGYRLLGTWAVRQTTDGEQRTDLSERRPGEPFQTNVPIAGSALIGRTASRQHLLDVLSAYRVVTLTGPGGIGKSALALDVARSLFPTLQGDCWFVELAALSDPALLPSAVASVLGVQIIGNEISAEAVARTIGGKKILLVFDNCEHLADAAAGLVEAIIRMCPNASVLATSREILRTEGEYVYRVPPLDVPPERQNDVADIGEFSAVQLFAARLAALDSDCSAHPEHLSLIASICWRLDGIPLAIEFAAARAATLGLQLVADRLDDRFALLTGGRRTALPRQQTLRATLDWSYELLSEAERTLLRRLSVFVGGFTLEAATAVMSGSDALASAVAENVASLAAKSLISLDASVPSGRWRLLETIRAYASDKLAESGEADRIARRHAEFFRNLSTPSIEGPIVALDDLPRYSREIDNLRAALGWAFSRDDIDVGLRIGLAVAAAPVLLAMSLLPECHRWSERALAALDDARRGSAEEMHLQATLGFSLLHTHGGNDATESALNRALTIAEERGAFLYLMWLQSSLNVFHTRNGDFKNALRNARRTSAVASLTGDSAAVALAHFQLGNSLQFTGDPDGARVELEAALQLRPRSPQTSTIYLGYDHYILASVCLANTLSLQGYPDQAAERAREAVKDAERIDNPLTLSIALRYAILLFLRIGDLQTADEFIEWYISIAQSNSLAPQVAAGRGLMGALAVRRGDAQGGVEMLRNALEKLHAMHNDLMASRFNLSLAEGLAASGRFAESMEVIDGGIRWVEEHGDFVYMPELLRAKGNLLLSIQPTHIDEAEKHFIHSLELCRQQGARSGELRTATDLARLMADRGRRKDARALLEPVFAWFTEGLDTADLKSAERVLTTLR